MRCIPIRLSAVALVAVAASALRAEEPKTGRQEVKAEEFGSYYLLDVPEKYSQDRTWPLLVALHGAGDNAKNFISLWAQLAPKEGFLLAVPCGEAKAPGWSDDQRTWSGDSPKFIMWMVEKIRKEYRINEDRIYLNGFSAGGHMTFYAGLLNPGIFSAIVPCSGCVMQQTTDSDLEKAKNLPVRVLIGEKDPNYQPVLQSVERLKKAGFKTVVLRTFPELAHQYPQDENPKILKWFDELYGEKIKAKGLTETLEKAKKAFEEKKYSEAAEAARKITSLGITAPVSDEAAALLANIEALGRDLLDKAKTELAAGSVLAAVAALRSVKKDFAGLDCARAAADREKELLADPAVRRKIAEEEARLRQEEAENAASESLAKAAALLASGKAAEALKAFDEVARKHPSTAAGKDAADRAAKMRADKGLMAGLDLEKNLKSAKGWYQMAENLRKNGKRDEALKYYRKIVDLVPDTDIGKAARDRISELK